MRVLVTRPLHSGARTAERLVEMGHEPLLLPLSQPVHDAAEALTALSQTDGAIAVTSAEAIRALRESRYDLSPHLHRALFAVGEATAEEAAAAGFLSVVASSGNGADLADMIAEQSRGPVLYLAGLPRAETFETRARQIGLHVVVANCYHMEPLPVAADAVRALLERQPDSILFYSRQTTEAFFAIEAIRMHPETIADVRLLCLSAAVAAAVPKPLQGNVAVAAAPNEASLLSLI
ncbi:uroporphyrinogen-III synthase [Rhizobium sp. S96]|uniref:uroporphyrinogen-III synthase n=1 Tax=Rhizobium sp. S96 TaxID=3055140 RepID=UPI0025AB4952|nr:uroporphyrinogen-III synthase [Rhizobium sp. S96]MDM9621418.1 uroporphyrinogen-III synthase [Rhizobium sp. S96]